MAEERKSFSLRTDEKGGINITSEVVATVAGLAATEVEGVSSLAGNLTSTLIVAAGANKLARGVKVTADEDDVLSIRIFINISYGYGIPKVCQQVQDKVKDTVENMLGLTVGSVNIKVANVSLEE